MESERPLLAGVLITKNAELRLGACLESVKGWVDEIVVLDSGSTDRTLEIATAHGCRVHVDTDWQGFGRQRQRAQGFVQARWCLWIDADECVTEFLRVEILRVVQQPPGRVVYTFPRLNWFFGRFIRHGGWYPKPVARLYPTDLTRYNDASVHESIEIPEDVSVIDLRGDLLHFPYATLRQYVEKSTRYAHDWAVLKHRQGKRTSMPGVIMRSLLRFVRMYLLKGGLLDGKQGLLLAILSSYYTFMKYADLLVLEWARSKD